MKLQAVFFVAATLFGTQVLAIPQYTTTSSYPTPQTTCVLNCGGLLGLQCPGGYSCCGDTSGDQFGRCLPGKVCPY